MFGDKKTQAAENHTSTTSRRPSGSHLAGCRSGVGVQNVNFFVKALLRFNLLWQGRVGEVKKNLVDRESFPIFAVANTLQKGKGKLSN